jgi:hypothetical protein
MHSEVIIWRRLTRRQRGSLRVKLATIPTPCVISKNIYIYIYIYIFHGVYGISNNKCLGALFLLQLVSVGCYGPDQWSCCCCCYVYLRLNVWEYIIQWWWYDSTPVWPTWGVGAPSSSVAREPEYSVDYVFTSTTYFFAVDISRLCTYNIKASPKRNYYVWGRWRADETTSGSVWLRTTCLGQFLQNLHVISSSYWDDLFILI